jgi:hypothetical protein
MRSPGCCTNHEACWLGNGRHIIRVDIADPFCCPVCGSDLVPPAIETISQTGVRKAVVASLALILAAGGSGFGLVKLLHVVGLGEIPVSAPAVVAGVARRPRAGAGMLHPASAPHMAAGVTSTPATIPATTPATTQVATSTVMPTAASAAAANTPVQQAVTTVPPGRAPITVVLGTRTLKPASRVLIATSVSQEPLRALTLPISFGLPEPPEDDTPAPARRWRSRVAVTPEPRNELLPAPGDPDSAAVDVPAQAETPATMDGDDATPDMVAANASQAPEVMPDEDAGRNGMAGIQPTVQPDSAPPATVAEGGFGWSAVRRALQPRVDEPPKADAIQVEQAESIEAAQDSLPAARVDPAMAQQIDTSKDAPQRLATLPPAPADKLAVPAYPPVQAEIERPGRVDVGCVITPHGLPSGCHLQHELGGTQFVDSVMNWLHSGAVRYRPHLAHGRPVPEPRTYRVRFEP